MKAYIEYAAYYVNDMVWYLKFFEEVLKLLPYRQRTTEGHREKAIAMGAREMPKRKK